MATKNWITISGDTPQAKLAAVADVLRLEDKPLEWTRPGIGPVWRSKGGEFTISARRGPLGTLLHLERLTFPESCHQSLQAAKEAAEKARRQVTVVVRVPQSAKGVR